MSDGRTWGTIIGGVVGYFTGGIGFAAGAAIGGAVGGLLEPKKHTETNRIEDIKVSISRYGDGIPETHGNNIPPATWVWSTYIIQMPEKQSSGKGGGVENTNYRQFLHGLICLGKSPPPGSTVTIRKAIIDGKLNFDASSGLSPAQALATEENPFASILLFDGQDGQLPIPIIEAYEGIGNVPAFTGRLTGFVFGLECPGGRVPQIQLEICVNAALSTELSEFCTVVTDTPDGYHAFFAPDGIWHLRESGDAANRMLDVYYGGPGYSKRVRSASLPPSKTGAIHDWPCLPCHGSAQPLALRVQTDLAGTTSTVEIIELDTGVLTNTLSYGKDAAEYPLASSIFASCCCDEGPTKYALIGGGEAWQQTDAVVIFGGQFFRCAPIVGSVAGPIAMRGDVVLILTETAGTLTIERRNATNGTVLPSFPGPTPPVIWNVQVCALYASDKGLFVQVPGEDRETYRIYRVDLASGAWSLVTEITAPGVYPSASSNFFSSDRIHLLGPSESTEDYSIIVKVLEPALADVAEVIESQCLRAGLTAEQVDVSTVNDQFWGLTYKGPASARANVAPLMTYSALGVVEEDGLLRFFNRKDKAFVATISYDELGFVEDGSEPGDPFPVVHVNAQELPRSLTLSYNDPNFDYQVSTVKAWMLSVASGADLNETLDMAMDGARAATIARRLLLERWIAQNTRSLTVSRAYAYLSAGDVIRVEFPRGTLSDWMTSKLTDTGARIEIECFPADSDLIIQSVPGPSGFQAQQIQPLAPPQQLQLIDGPILQDADNNAGIYAAMEPFGGGSPGAELFVGDDDSSLQSRGAVSNAAVIGLAENALGDFLPNMMDETNALIVDIGEGVLNSTTRALIDTTTVNAFALGVNGRWEYGQFLRAIDLGSGRFMLTGLVRGARGTQHNRGNHAAGDSFVLLSLAGMLRPSMDVGAIGATKSYRAVSLGRSFNSASSQRYANTGEGLRPLSPWDVRKSKAASNDQTLTWERRTRLSSNVLRGIVPLGEATESYSLDFYTSSAFTTLAGTLTSTSRTLTVTSAQQAAMGLTPGAALNVRIYQISESVGRGHALEATI